ALTVTTAEPPGPNCPDGGTRIDAGLDANGDGTLDLLEVTATTYACNGAAGAPGSNGGTGPTGLTALLKTGAEPAGADGATGGTRIANVDGTPVRSSTQMRPWCAATASWQKCRPRPKFARRAAAAPSPWLNFAKMRARCSGGTGGPLFPTVSSMSSPSRFAEISMEPPDGVCRKALSSRFSTTRSRRSSSTVASRRSSTRSRSSTP